MDTPMKRPSESLVTLLAAVWMVITVGFSIRSELSAAVNTVIGASGFLWSAIIDHRRAR